MSPRALKSDYRYSDYYCYMSLSDFNAYIAREDDDESFPISRKEGVENS